MHSIRVRPHNSDSEGRRFESCRAYQRQNNTIRSSAAAHGVRSTDGVVFTFQIEPASLGFDLVFIGRIFKTAISFVLLAADFYALYQ